MAIGVDRMLDAMQVKEQQVLADLLVRLVKEGALTKADLLQGSKKPIDQLDDLR